MAEPDFTWMVGGQSGEGIDTTGELFALTLCRLGYHIFAYRHFPSRIRGGHTHYKLRIAGWQVRSPAAEVDCLVAFDQGSIDWNWAQIRHGGMIVHDAAFACKLPPARPDLTAYAVPMSDLAAETGAVIMKNMVAVGVSAAFLGLPPDPFAEAVRRRFAGKGAEVATANAELVRKGHAFASGHHRPALRFAVAPEPASGGARYLLSGNEALAYGALAGGCRFVAAYPITPATEIMQWLARELPAYGGTVVQCEDELAAVNMAVGAAYAGARALASTSGPGFSLMTEGMGLAGAAEQPIVIVDDQRGGPSTGLPTKTEQADLQHAVYGGHGEFPRIVLTPLTVEDCFDAAVDAFNLAERFQCPVVLAPDLALAMCRQTIDGLDFARVRIDRGRLADPEDLAVHGAGRFRRYEISASGISPRAFPGQPGGQHLVTGTEHDATGTVSDTPANRAAQQAKRLRKLAAEHPGAAGGGAVGGTSTMTGGGAGTHGMSAGGSAVAGASAVISGGAVSRGGAAPGTSTGNGGGAGGGGNVVAGGTAVAGGGTFAGGSAARGTSTVNGGGMVAGDGAGAHGMSAGGNAVAGASAVIGGGAVASGNAVGGGNAVASGDMAVGAHAAASGDVAIGAHAATRGDVAIGAHAATTGWLGTGARAIEVAGLNEGEAPLLLIGFGSTAGALEEARRALAADGHRVARLSVRIPHPFPRAEVAAAIARASAALIVEGNAGGQLERLLRQEGCVPDGWAEPGQAEDTLAALLATPLPEGGAAVAGPARWRSLRRWDGNPVLSAEIVAAARAMAGRVVAH